MAKAVKETKTTPEATEAKTLSENVDATFDKMNEMAEKAIIDETAEKTIIEETEKIEEISDETKNISVDDEEVIEPLKEATQEELDRLNAEDDEKSESVKADGYSTDEEQSQDASGDASGDASTDDSTDDSEEDEDDSEEEKTVEPLTEGEILEQIKELIKVEHNFNYVSFGRHLKNELTSENLKLFANEFKSSGMLTTPNHYKLMSLFDSYFAETK